jgi:hypothetical protein
MKNRDRAWRWFLLGTGYLLVLGVACNNPAPRVQVVATPLNPRPNEQVTYMATALDADGIAEIRILVDGALVTTCVGPGPCTATHGPYPGSDQDLVVYEAEAKDTKGKWGSIGPYNFAVGRPWQNQTWIPVRGSTLSADDAIDVCFGGAADYLGNIDLLLTHVADKIYNRYLQNTQISLNEHKYRFFYTASSMSGANCGSTLSNAQIAGQGPQCNAVAILHQVNTRDCTVWPFFTAEGTETQAFVHESGHAIFGLADEYEGNTSYFMPSPYANIWLDIGPGSNTGQQWCQADVAAYGGDPSQCNEFCNDPVDCNFGWWRYTTNTTMMTQGFFSDPWGLPALRRVVWLHAKY